MPSPTPRSSAVRVLLTGATTLLAAYFALWACAPGPSLRPPVTMAVGDGTEIGVGAGFRGDWEQPLETEAMYEGADVLLYADSFVARRLSLGGYVSAGSTAIVSVGGHLRGYLTRPGPVNVALDLEAGWLSAGLSVPMAVRLAKNGPWLYTSPGVILRNSSIVRVPVGIAVPFGDRVRLDVEGMVGWPGSTGGGRPQLGAAAALSFTVPPPASRLDDKRKGPELPVY